MSDLIRREDALRVTLAYASSYSAEQAETAINALPAVQPDADKLVGHMTKLIAAGLDRIEQLTAERDAAYAQGYSDAETEISKSALGQINDFLRSQYDNAKLRIEALTVDRAEARAGWHKYEGAWMAAEGKLADVEAERDRLRKAILFWLEAQEPDVDAAINMMRAALKGETP